MLCGSNVYNLVGALELFSCRSHESAKCRNPALTLSLSLFFSPSSFYNLFYSILLYVCLLFSFSLPLSFSLKWMREKIRAEFRSLVKCETNCTWSLRTKYLMSTKELVDARIFAKSCRRCETNEYGNTEIHIPRDTAQNWKLRKT